MSTRRFGTCCFSYCLIVQFGFFSLILNSQVLQRCDAYTWRVTTHLCLPGKILPRLCPSQMCLDLEDELYGYPMKYSLLSLSCSIPHELRCI